MNRLWTLSLLFILLATVHCSDPQLVAVQGGTGAGNPAFFRTISGMLASENGGTDVGGVCAADTVMANDLTSQTIKVSVYDDCSFKVRLNVEKSYSIGFEFNNETIAVLRFSASFSTASLSDPEKLLLMIPPGKEDIHFGLISIMHGVALAQYEPDDQLDNDDDGIPNSLDDDDDNDGIEDGAEADCDLDGIIDDHDTDNSTCDDDSESEGEEYEPEEEGEEEGEEEEGEDDDEDPPPPPETVDVLQVAPHNGRGINPGTFPVFTDEPVAAVIGCSVDMATVDSSTFRIVGTGNELIDCTFIGLTDDTFIVCVPVDLLSNDTIYGVTLQNIQCENGEYVKETNWFWKTIE